MDDRELIIKDMIERCRSNYLKSISRENASKTNESFKNDITTMDLTLNYIAIYLANKGLQPGFVLTLIEDFYEDLAKKHKELIQYEELKNSNNNNIHSNSKKMGDEIWNG